MCFLLYGDLYGDEGLYGGDEDSISIVGPIEEEEAHADIITDNDNGNEDGQWPSQSTVRYEKSEAPSILGSKCRSKEIE